MSEDIKKSLITKLHAYGLRSQAALRHCNTSPLTLQHLLSEQPEDLPTGVAQHPIHRQGHMWSWEKQAGSQSGPPSTTSINNCTNTQGCSPRPQTRALCSPSVSQQRSLSTLVSLGVTRLLAEAQRMTCS